MPHQHSKGSELQPGKVLNRLDPDEVAKTLRETQGRHHLKAYKPSHLARMMPRLDNAFERHDPGHPAPAKLGSEAASKATPWVAEDISPAPPWPMSSVGRVFVGRYPDPTVLWTGIGVVMQPDLIYTAGHTVPWTFDQWWMRFVPAFNKGDEPLGEVYVSECHGWNLPANPAAMDLAICKLYQPFGNTTTGWMGTYANGSDDFYTSGYPLSYYGSISGYNGDSNLLYTYRGSGFIISDIKDDGSFKLMWSPWASDEFTEAVLWDWFEGQPMIFGIMSGSGQNKYGLESLGFAGGMGLIQLAQWGIINFA